MPFRTEIRDGVAELVIDHPPVNALPTKAWAELARTVETLGRDPAVRVLVIRAEGRGFQCGVDVKELAADGALIVDANRGCYDTFGAIYDCPVPVISAVHGYCLGGGIGIAGSSDFVIASEDATFGLPEIDRGAMGAATHAMRMFGMQEARRMLLTGEPIGAEEARQLGMVNRVVPREELQEATLALARKIAGQPTFATKMVKQAVNAAEDAQGRHAAFQVAFALHHLAHSHWMEIYGVPVDPSGIHGAVKKNYAPGEEPFRAPDKKAAG